MNHWGQVSSAAIVFAALAGCIQPDGVAAQPGLLDTVKFDIVPASHLRLSLMGPEPSTMMATIRLNTTDPGKDVTSEATTDGCFFMSVNGGPPEVHSMIGAETSVAAGEITATDRAAFNLSAVMNAVSDGSSSATIDFWFPGADWMRAGESRLEVTVVGRGLEAVVERREDVPSNCFMSVEDWQGGQRLGFGIAGYLSDVDVWRDVAFAHDQKLEFSLDGPGWLMLDVEQASELDLRLVGPAGDELGAWGPGSFVDIQSLPAGTYHLDLNWYRASRQPGNLAGPHVWAFAASNRSD